MVPSRGVESLLAQKDAARESLLVCSLKLSHSSLSAWNQHRKDNADKPRNASSCEYFVNSPKGNYQALAVSCDRMIDRPTISVCASGAILDRSAKFHVFGSLTCLNLSADLPELSLRDALKT